MGDFFVSLVLFFFLPHCAKSDFKMSDFVLVSGYAVNWKDKGLINRLADRNLLSKTEYLFWLLFIKENLRKQLPDVRICDVGTI